jgi:hypothetical protein
MHEALTWIPTSAIPLATVEGGNGFADPKPRCGVMGGARIVSPGEAAHGKHALPDEAPARSSPASPRWLRAPVYDGR